YSQLALLIELFLTTLMCGIIGKYKSYLSDNLEGEIFENCVKKLVHRGPDHTGIWRNDKVSLGHTRLSIVDTSSVSNQPFIDSSGKYVIVFNGEILNYKEIKEELETNGIEIKTNGDVEVLLELYKFKGENSLNQIRGFFAFAIYNLENHEIFLARDRFGVKPLYYFYNGDCLIFSSEIKAILPLLPSAKLNNSSVSVYFQLNYIAGNDSIIDQIKKLAPGHYALVNSKGFNTSCYYSISERFNEKSANNKDEIYLRTLLIDSIKDRMVADVPVGSFLSGGIDSTIITGLASKQRKDLSTFCLGFKNNKWFDEAPYAEIAAKHFNTDHHTFYVDETEMLAELDNFLNSIDEPFADSSALNLYILSKKTKNFVKVVLSGDGADEIFAGYNKHRAIWLLNNSSFYNLIAKFGLLAGNIFPSSRNTAFSNTIRQLQKLGQIRSLGKKERYWRTASISSEIEVLERFKNPSLFLEGRKSVETLLKNLNENSTLNDYLLEDVKIVLEGDMLVKADRMSMCHGLEIRNPFLDYRLVEYALNLPEAFKLNKKQGKIILRETFKDIIPSELINRKKHGFELPLHRWLKNPLRERVEKIYFNRDFIEEQNIFKYDEILKIKQKLFSNNPGDTPAKTWAILVFNHWYMKNKSYFN
ncbi:MAG: asparagine synthase (glutamine-hydrolyzing), partial [Bacteroidota bacterium]